MEMRICGCRAMRSDGINLNAPAIHDPIEVKSRTA